MSPKDGGYGAEQHMSPKGASRINDRRRSSSVPPMRPGGPKLMPRAPDVPNKSGRKAAGQKVKSKKISTKNAPVFVK